MDHDLIADLPALHLVADRPDNARSIRARNVIVLFMHVKWRDRHAETGPDTIVIDTGGHHHDQNLVAVERPGADHGEWSKRTFSPEHGQAGGSPRPHRDLSSARHKSSSVPACPVPWGELQDRCCTAESVLLPLELQSCAQQSNSIITYISNIMSAAPQKYQFQHLAIARAAPDRETALGKHTGEGKCQIL